MRRISSEAVEAAVKAASEERENSRPRHILYDHAGRIFRAFLNRTAVAKVTFKPLSLREYEIDRVFKAVAEITESEPHDVAEPYFAELLEAICQDAVNEVLPGIRFDFDFVWEGMDSEQVVITIPYNQSL